MFSFGNSSKQFKNAISDREFILFVICLCCTSLLLPRVVLLFAWPPSGAPINIAVPVGATTFIRPFGPPFDVNVVSTLQFLTFVNQVIFFDSV